MRRLLLTIVAVAVLPVAACAQAAASSDVTFVQQVAREITEVKSSITPAEWLRAHAGERLQLFNGPQFANDTEQWCARTVVERSTGTDRTWTRSVYFYDPRPPADDALPAPPAFLFNLGEIGSAASVNKNGFLGIRVAQDPRNDMDSAVTCANHF